MKEIWGGSAMRGRVVIIRCLIFMLFFSWLTGCIVYRGYRQAGFEPSVNTLRGNRYEVLGEAESRVSNFTLLWVWTVTEPPDYDRAIREIISEKGGDDIIEVSYWLEKQHWLLGTVDIMHIKGKVIRYIEE